MEVQLDRLPSPTVESISPLPTDQHDSGLSQASDQPQNFTTEQLDANELNRGLNAGASEHEPPSDTKLENEAQENEEPVKGGAESSNSIEGTETSSDPCITGENANESTDAHVDAVDKCGVATQEDDTSQSAQFTPEDPLPTSERPKVSFADELDAEKKISTQIDDDQQQQQQQISPSAAGDPKDEPPSNTKLEGANTGNAAQETEKPVKGAAESSNSLQETESFSDKQKQQDLSKSDRDPVSQNASARADSNEGGNCLQAQEVQVKTEQAQLTVSLKAELQQKRGIIYQQRIVHQEHMAECCWKLEEQRAKEREMYMEMNRLKEENKKLVEQILHLEQQHAAKSSQGGSYLDDSKAATPALLSAAVSTVRDTGRKFTKEFMDQLKKCPKDIRSEVEGRILENFKVAIPQATRKKFQYQAYMNHKLFDGFDNRDFSTLVKNVDNPPSDFLSMEEAEWYQKECFKQFQRYDLRKFPVKMLVDNADHDLSLKEFCFLKFQSIFDEPTEYQLFGRLEHRDCIVHKQKHPNTPFYTSFCKFAVSVWLVHRLAFAFKTPATTFVVEEDLPFNCLKMESAGPADDITPDSRVGFVVLPGFQVSQSTIPCEVYLVEKTQDKLVLDGH